MIIPDYICGYDAEKLEEIVAKVLTEKSITVSVAESCTGGYISHLLTSISGSSTVF
ncbi:MAG: CinA family protein [Marinilabiliales bacterium]|nr:CinA family protein [Marinilabiliales bacterium]